VSFPRLVLIVREVDRLSSTRERLGITDLAYLSRVKSQTAGQSCSHERKNVNRDQVPGCSTSSNLSSGLARSCSSSVPWSYSHSSPHLSGRAEREPAAQAYMHGCMMYPANGATYAGGTLVPLYLVPLVSEKRLACLRGRTPNVRRGTPSGTLVYQGDPLEPFPFECWGCVM
jgi:hypothetical protein